MSDIQSIQCAVLSQGCKSHFILFFHVFQNIVYWKRFWKMSLKCSVGGMTNRHNSNLLNRLYFHPKIKIPLSSCWFRLFFSFKTQIKIFLMKPERFLSYVVYRRIKTQIKSVHHKKVISGSKSQKYNVWVKVLDFSFMPKIITIVVKDRVPWRYICLHTKKYLFLR